MSVVPLSELGLCITDASVVQAACDAAILAREASFIAWAQTGATAAIVAANLPDSADVQAACDAAILAREASLTAWSQTGAAAAIAAANLPDTTDVEAACAAAIAAASLATSANVAAIPAAVLGVAVTTYGLGHSTFSFGAGPTEGEVMAPIAGRKFQIYGFVAILSGAGGSVTLRSGTAVNAPGNSNLSAAYPLSVGVPLPIPVNPNKYPLWTTVDNEGIYVAKPAAGSCIGEVWWVAADN